MAQMVYLYPRGTPKEFFRIGDRQNRYYPWSQRIPTSLGFQAGLDLNEISDMGYSGIIILVTQVETERVLQNVAFLRDMAHYHGLTLTTILQWDTDTILSEFYDPDRPSNYKKVVNYLVQLVKYSDYISVYSPNEDAIVDPLGTAQIMMAFWGSLPEEVKSKFLFHVDEPSIPSLKYLVGLPEYHFPFIVEFYHFPWLLAPFPEAIAITGHPRSWSFGSPIIQRLAIRLKLSLAGSFGSKDTALRQVLEVFRLPKGWETGIWCFYDRKEDGMNETYGICWLI